jgi:hypothetical protein
MSILADSPEQGGWYWNGRFYIIKDPEGRWIKRSQAHPEIPVKTLAELEAMPVADPNTAQ